MKTYENQEEEKRLNTVILLALMKIQAYES